ncbi:hypothetical protein FRB93_005355 [Tulasnella sp. JGI-2019a]|nr:hypothetical protein FRB93_005355 [Tulasnella sp. JGI-2019a]
MADPERLPQRHQHHHQPPAGQQPRQAPNNPQGVINSHEHGHGHGRDRDHDHSHGQEEDHDELEARHFAKIVETFRKYGTYHLSANNRRRKDFLKLPISNQKLLEDLGWRSRLNEVDYKIAENAQFLNMVVDHPDIFAMEMEGPGEDGDRAADEHSHHQHETNAHQDHHSHSHDGQEHTHGSSSGEPKKVKKEDKPGDFEMDKLRSTLKQFARDWSSEGNAEREASYKPMLDALFEHFSDVPHEERLNIRVLVPGAGLARLAWEVAKAGFASQGNEFSHFMLLSSYFVLNRTDQVNQHTIYPYVHSFSNIRSASDLTRAITIPDVRPSDLPNPSDFSLVAGDFTEVYGVTNEDERRDPMKESQEGKWNAVLTCFFIDTAKDIVEYLKIIHRLLMTGGVWINLGPLLWHWENNQTGDPSIELSLEEVKALAKTIGFELSNERMVPTTYTGINDGMVRFEYQAEFWVAKKV